VVGGGDVAVEDAIFLARGCEKVYVVHRRDELRAVKTLQTALFALPNVEMVWDSNLKSINDSGDGKVTSVTVVNKYDKSERVIDADGVFIAVGITPRSGFVGTGIETNAGGYIVAGETCETSIPGIFVAGDASGIEEASSAMVEGYLAGLCAAAKLGYVPADYEARRQDYLAQLEGLRSGPVGDRIRAGMKLSKL
jgi:thioredoxin reductase (NADPH)